MMELSDRDDHRSLELLRAAKKLRSDLLDAGFVAGNCAALQQAVQDRTVSGPLVTAEHDAVLRPFGEAVPSPAHQLCLAHAYEPLQEHELRLSSPNPFACCANPEQFVAATYKGVVSSDHRLFRPCLCKVPLDHPVHRAVASVVRPMGDRSHPNCSGMRAEVDAPRPTQCDIPRRRAPSRRMRCSAEHPHLRRNRRPGPTFPEEPGHTASLSLPETEPGLDHGGTAARRLVLLPAQLIDRLLEVVEVLKAPVYAREAQVGDEIEGAQRAKDGEADVVGVHLGIAGGADRLLHLLGQDGKIIGGDGSPWHAFLTPLMTFERSNGSAAPERFTTVRLVVSTVVKRLEHTGH